MSHAAAARLLPPEQEPLNEADPYARKTQTFPVLDAEQIARMKAFGTVERMEKGAVLFERNQRNVDFFVILSGQIDIYEHHENGDTHVFTSHSAGHFTGELDLFNSRQILVGGRMGVTGEVLRVARRDFRRMMTSEPDLGEIITRAFILRRVALISHKQGSVTVLCARETPDSLRITRFLRRNGYPLQVLDDEADAERTALLKKYALADADLPAVLIHLGERVVRCPTNAQLAECLGMMEELNPEHVFDVAIVGAGPAGLSAAVYAASEGCDTVVLESEAPGGQAGTSSKIENFLGFPTGISGQALAGRAQVQAQKFGAKIVLPHRVVQLNCDQRPFTLTLDNDSVIKARSIVIATGATYRTLEIESGRRFDNAGVYYAATAMEAALCTGEEAIIIGGGNSAGQAAMYLSTKCRHVHIMVRAKGLSESMSQYLIERIASSPKITLHTETEIVAVSGERHLEEVTWEHRPTKARTKKPIRHVFLMLGAVPNTSWVKNCLALDEKGFVLTGTQLLSDTRWSHTRPPMPQETSIPGVFAAGDVRASSTKRVAFAVGDGGMSVSNVHTFLHDTDGA